LNGGDRVGRGNGRGTEQGERVGAKQSRTKKGVGGKRRGGRIRTTIKARGGVNIQEGKEKNRFTSAEKGELSDGSRELKG